MGIQTVAQLRLASPPALAERVGAKLVRFSNCVVVYRICDHPTQPTSSPNHHQRNNRPKRSLPLRAAWTPAPCSLPRPCPSRCLRRIASGTATPGAVCVLAFWWVCVCSCDVRVLQTTITLQRRRLPPPARARGCADPPHRGAPARAQAAPHHCPALVAPPARVACCCRGWCLAGGNDDEVRGQCVGRRFDRCSPLFEPS